MFVTGCASGMARYLPGWSEVRLLAVRRFDGTHGFVLPIFRCQWVDVTSIDTSNQTYTAPLSSSLNPDRFLCEGTLQPDTWIRTEFNTTCCLGTGCCGDSNQTRCCGGEPVYRAGCETWDEADDDNQSEVNVTLPLSGEGQVTEKCWNSTGSWGETRDCGLKLHPKGKYLQCDKPGEQVALQDVMTTDFYQVRALSL